MKLEKEIGLYSSEELEALIHEHGHIYVEFQSGDRLSMHKFEVVGTKGGGAVCTQYLEKSLDEADAFVVSQPEYYPLSRLNEAIESIKFRAVSKNPSKAWPNHSGPHPYSMFEVREILIDLEKN